MIVPGSAFIPFWTASDCDPYWDQVVLAMHMDDDLVDLKGNTITNNDVSLSSIEHPSFSEQSAHFNGSAYLDIPHNNSFNIETENTFTIELWVNPDSISTRQELIEKRYDSDPNYYGYGLLLEAGGTPRFYFTALFEVICTIPVTAGVENHVAVVRESSSIIKIYVNGDLAGTNSSCVNGVSSSLAAMRIGHDHVLGSWPFSGYLSDLRITKGVARYTANFTPPTQAFPDVACESTSNDLPWAEVPVTYLTACGDHPISSKFSASNATTTIDGDGFKTTTSGADLSITSLSGFTNGTSFIVVDWEATGTSNKVFTRPDFVLSVGGVEYTRRWMYSDDTFYPEEKTFVFALSAPVEPTDEIVVYVEGYNLAFIHIRCIYFVDAAY